VFVARGPRRSPTPWVTLAFIAIVIFGGLAMCVYVFVNQ
jgi:hypothetical protein